MSDELFKEPYVDVDEWRDGPVRHRYVHGGFKGTDTRFSFYLPPKEQYQGRFFQHITPVPDSENLAQQVPAGEENKIGFVDRQRRLLRRDQRRRQPRPRPGRRRPADPTIAAYRANAAAARYSRVVAQQMYGPHRGLRLCLWRQRRRLPHDRLDREHDAACGTGRCRS